MKYYVLSLAAIACLGLSACATRISQEKISNADYGAPPPENYKELIKTSLSRDLIDPTAPLFEYGQPSRGYFKSSPLFETYEMFGWKVCGTVNSKNRFGGYVGTAPYIVLFRDGAIMQKIIGDSDGSSIVNASIRDACLR